MKDFFPDRIEFLQFLFHLAPLWPNDPKTSVLVAARLSCLAFILVEKPQYIDFVFSGSTKTAWWPESMAKTSGFKPQCAIPRQIMNVISKPIPMFDKLIWRLPKTGGYPKPSDRCSLDLNMRRHRLKPWVDPLPFDSLATNRCNLKCLLSTGSYDGSR